MEPGNDNYGRISMYPYTRHNLILASARSICYSGLIWLLTMSQTQKDEITILVIVAYIPNFETVRMKLYVYLLTQNN